MTGSLYVVVVGDIKNGQNESVLRGESSLHMKLLVLFIIFSSNLFLTGRLGEMLYRLKSSKEVPSFLVKIKVIETV